MTRRIGLAQSAKPPVLEFDGTTWQVWTAYNKDLTLGTRFVLSSDGSYSIVTINPDGTIAETKQGMGKSG